MTISVHFYHRILHGKFSDQNLLVILRGQIIFFYFKLKQKTGKTFLTKRVFRLGEVGGV
jgi:hypothetical protein